MGEREEMQRLQQKYEYDKLAEIWQLFTEGTHLNGHPGDGIHMAPAFQALLTDRLAEIWQDITTNFPIASERERMYSMKCTALLAQVFEFGQVCATLPTPIMYSKLTPCTCGNVTDEDIEALLKEKGA